MSNGTRNVVDLIGNVGKEPDVHTFPDGAIKTTVSLATSESWGDRDDRKTKTAWHTLVAFNGAAKIIKDYVHKRDKIAVLGRLDYRDFTDKDNVKRTVAEIVVNDVTLLSPKP